MNQEERQTRDRILQTALGLFLSQGYDNTSVQAIIDAVGIAKGTFYHHFRSKEAMLVDLVEGLSRRVVDAVAPVVQDPGLDAVAKMLALSRAAAQQKAEDFGPGVVVLIRQMQAKENRLLSDAIAEISKKWILPLYARVIREGIEQGVFRVRHPELAAELILGTILSMQDRVTALFLAAVDGEGGAVDRLLGVYEAIEEAVERLLGTQPGALPIYTVVDIRSLLARLVPGGIA